MKKSVLISSLFMCCIAIQFSCEGPQGPAGPAGPEGPQGPAGPTGSSCSVEDNGDGTFTMTCEGSGPVIFGETEEPPAYTNADVVRGGQLYDKYWIVTGGEEPTGEHLLYPSVGIRTGSTTWRCKECHGWDYIGKDGRYAGGSHYTGIKGLYPVSKSLWLAFISLRNDHAYSTTDLSDADIWDLVKFYREGMIDINLLQDEDGAFLGDISSGSNIYNDGISGVQSGSSSTNTACTACHGSDGTNEVVTGFDAFPGFLSNDNPQEFQHKIRFGHPGSNMPASESINGSLRDVTDLSAYSQTLSPVLWTSTSVSRGGQLYDRYWAVTGGIVPTGDHVLYPPNALSSESSTWRCKECHGWDYIGKEGRYASGSHYTGIKGIYPATNTKWQAFEEIRENHEYNNEELSDSDIWDLVAFYNAGTYDINFILNPDGTFRGDPVNGQILYNNGIGGGASCASCHGVDGLNEVVTGFDDFPGFLSNDNPQEFAHKVLYGHPGSAMVITYDYGATMENVSDLSAWCQTLPQN
jgi:mono/diheme cytochrome c family protein